MFDAIYSLKTFSRSIFSAVQKTDIGNAIPLSFRISNDMPEDISAEGNFRKIGRAKGQNIYSVGSMLSTYENSMLERVKGDIINKSIKENWEVRDSGEGIKKAYNSAIEMLNACNCQNNCELIAYLAAHDTHGSGPFSILLEDSKNIEEIMINKAESNITLYHSELGFCKTNMCFKNGTNLRFMLNKLINESDKEISSETPIVEAQLYDGSRVHAQIKPFAANGAVVSIRLNNENKISIKKLLNKGIDAEVLAFFWHAIEADANIMVVGAPASGKTSLLLAASSFIPAFQRVIVIEEEANELKFGSNFINAVNIQSSSNSKAVLKDQVVNALHLRPDRLIIGELRGEETKDVFSAGNLGVPFMTTLHSNIDEKSLISRLSSRPMSVEPHTISALDIAIFMKKEQSRRIIEKVSEYEWVVNNEVGIADAENRRYKVVNIIENGRLNTGILKKSKIMGRYAMINTISVKDAVEELESKAKYLDFLKENQVDETEYIRNYGV